jgi:thymidylate kinase
MVEPMAEDDRHVLSGTLAAEGTGRDGVHAALHRVLDLLDARGIAWALLRGVEELREASGDIDLLVDPAREGAVAEIVRSAGFARMPARGHGSHQFFILYSQANDRWLTLDIVSDVTFGEHQEFRAGVARVLLARRQRSGPGVVLADSDAFWHLLLHHLLRDGDVPERRRPILRARAGGVQDDSPLAALADGLHRGSASRLRVAVAEDDWPTVVELGRLIRRTWRRRQAWAPVRASAMTRIVRQVPPPIAERGVSLAILGPDGAGKTTLARALVASVPIPALYVYLGIWQQSPLEDRLQRVFGARLLLRLSSLLVKAVRIGYHRRLGRLVVLDRYTSDADLPGRGLDRKARVSARLARMTNLRPDLMLLLDAPAEVMRARKPEHDLAEIQQLRRAYLDMVGRFPQMVVLDAAQPLDAVRRQAAAVLWEALSWRRPPSGEPASVPAA